MITTVNVNNYRAGVFQYGEVFIQTDTRQLEANKGKVYLTIGELRELLELAESVPELDYNEGIYDYV